MENDIAACLKSYIESFRLVELKEFLQRLRLRTTGSKSALLERLKEYIAKERDAGRLQPQSPIVHLLHSFYQEKMRTPLTLPMQSGSLRALKCICSSQGFDDAEQRVADCTSINCSCREHFYCLFGANNIPEWTKTNHRCIRCRAYFADPFWLNARPDDIIPPTLIQEHIPQAFLSQQTATLGFKLLIREFCLAHSDVLHLRTSNAKMQIICLQLDDPVLFRFHWPMNCKLCVNGKDLRVYPRHADNKITEGQRDEPFDISKLVVAGKNSIEISCQDTNPYVILVQMVAPVRRDVVMNMMHAPENLEASIMRVRRIVRCQVSNDSDDEVQTMTSTMSLKCPFSFKRIETPARLLNVDSLECVFDLDAFITMAQKTRKWACPHSLRQSSVEDLVRDVWLESVLKTLRKLPEVMEIEVSKEGMWRLRGEFQWRSVYNTAVIERAPQGWIQEMDGHSSDDETEDENEELRKAALAAKDEVKKHYQERTQSQSLEIVDLISSDDDAETQVPPNLSPLTLGDVTVYPVAPANIPMQSGLGMYQSAMQYEPPVQVSPNRISGKEFGYSRNETFHSIQTGPPPLHSTFTGLQSASERYRTVFPAPLFPTASISKADGVYMNPVPNSFAINDSAQIKKRTLSYDARPGNRRMERKTRVRPSLHIDREMECIEIPSDDSE